MESAWRAAARQLIERVSGDANREEECEDARPEATSIQVRGGRRPDGDVG